MSELLGPLLKPLEMVLEKYLGWLGDAMSVRRAVQAEHARAKLAAEYTLEYLRVPGWENNHFNWLPIPTPIWDSVVASGKVGVLEPKSVNLYVWFFGYAKWINEGLLPLRTAFVSDGPEALARWQNAYAEALTRLVAGDWKRELEVTPLDEGAAG